MNRGRFLFFIITGLSSFGFLLARQMYFFATLVLLSQMVLVFALIPIVEIFEETGRRRRLGISSFVLFFVLFALLFRGEYRWPVSFDWAGAKNFHLSFGGEWLLLFSVCVAFVSVISALIVRRAK